MAEYTPNYNLYKPNRLDNESVDVTLSENFTKIDTQFKNVDDKFLAIENINANAELESARGGFVNLGTRLDSTDTQLAENTKKIDDIVLNIEDFGAKAEIGFDNIPALNAALTALPTGGTLLIPNKTYEIATEWVVNKPLTLVMYGTLKFTGTGTAVTLSCVDSNIHGLHVIRDFTATGAVSSQLLHNGVRFRYVKKTRLYNPVVNGFANGLFFDNTDGASNAYIDIYSPKIANCVIGYNRPEVGVGWTNEINMFGGGFEFSAGYSDYTGSKFVNIGGGDCHRFFGVFLESDHVERKVYTKGMYGLWNGCRFEGTNTICDIEVDGAYNQFVNADRLWWQNKIVDRGESNEFHFPKAVGRSIANKTYYVDYVNGSDTNDGLTSGAAFKNISRLLSFIPRQIDHDYIVYLLNGTFINAIVLNDIHGMGSLKIEGNLTDPSLCKLPYVSVRNCNLGKGISVKGVYSTAVSSTDTENSQFYVSNSVVDFDKIHAVDTTTFGVMVKNRGYVTLSNAVISNKQKAIYSLYGGDIVSISNSGTGNTVGLSALNGGKISKFNTTIPTATTAEEKNYGGLIVGAVGASI